MILDCNGGSPKGDHMTNTTPELLPCPFCAGEAELEKEVICFPNSKNDLWAVVCRNGDCPAGNMAQDGELGGFHYSWKRDEAIELWNTRPVMPDDVIRAYAESLLRHEDVGVAGAMAHKIGKELLALLEDEEQE